MGRGVARRGCGIAVDEGGGSCTVLQVMQAY
jgi:hypothetical protein